MDLITLDRNHLIILKEGFLIPYINTLLNKDNKNIFFLLFLIMYCTKSSHNSDLSNINYNNCINIQHELFLRVYRRRRSRLCSKIRYIHPTSLRSSSKQKPYIYWTVKENESKHLNTIMCIIQNKTRNVLQSFFTKILNSTSLFGLF